MPETPDIVEAIGGVLPDVEPARVRAAAQSVQRVLQAERPPEAGQAWVDALIREMPINMRLHPTTWDQLREYLLERVAPRA